MFTDILDKLMEARGINKHVLAKESGIPYTTIDGWYKKGYDEIRLSTLKKLRSYFGVTLDYLMGEAEKTQAITLEPSTPKYSLVVNFQNASPDDQAVLLHIASRLAQPANSIQPERSDSELAEIAQEFVREQVRLQTKGSVAGNK